MDKSKITVVSADPLIATVDQDLNLVAPGKTGKALVTLNYRYGNGLLSTSFMVTVKRILNNRKLFGIQGSAHFCNSLKINCYICKRVCIPYAEIVKLKGEPNYGKAYQRNTRPL